MPWHLAFVAHAFPGAASTISAATSLLAVVLALAARAAAVAAASIAAPAIAASLEVAVFVAAPGGAAVFVAAPAVASPTAAALFSAVAVCRYVWEGTSWHTRQHMTIHAAGILPGPMASTVAPSSEEHNQSSRCQLGAAMPVAVAEGMT